MSLKIAKTSRRPNSPQRTVEDNKYLTFLDHLVELRNRVVVVAFSVTVGALIAYSIQKQLIAVLIKPAHGQHFIYTSPIGGVGFLFSLSTDFGILLSVPIIVYEILCFINPVLRYSTKKVIIRYCLASGVLAAIGVVAGYFLGLPLVLRFLSHPFSTNQIQPLFTISQYLTFVSYYLFGAALIMLIPVITLFINRITPLKPKTLFHYERHVIVAAFIISAIMAPTISIINLSIMAIPIIVIYQLGIALIWYINRNRHTHKQWADQDRAIREQRQKVSELARPLYAEVVEEPSRTVTMRPKRPRLIDVIG